MTCACNNAWPDRLRVAAGLLAGLLFWLPLSVRATDAEIRAGSVVTTLPLHTLREAETRKLELGGERLEIARQEGRIRFSYLGPVGVPLSTPEVAAGLPADDSGMKCTVLVGEKAIAAYTLMSKAPWTNPVTAISTGKDVPGCTETPQLECGSGAILSTPRASSSVSPAKPAVESLPKLSVQCFPR